VALAAALHFDTSTPNFFVQEAFGDFDVPWRDQLVRSRHRLVAGQFIISDEPGLGVELDLAAIADHPYVPNAFPSLWDAQWTAGFTRSSDDV
jgi:galactonate dehydratase